MRLHIGAVALAITVLPQIGRAQTANPVADAFRANEKDNAKNLIAAADLMPAAKFGFKPTPAQMSWGDVMVHLSKGNDALCSAIGGVAAPQRSPLAGTDDKDKLVARLRETFAFCDQTLAKLDDSKLNEQLSLFGSKSSRATAMLEAAGDWSDHYSQLSIYLRLNGLLPPTAKK